MARDPRPGGGVSAEEWVLVAALDRAGAIGRAGAMPWHLPDDFRHFKALTLGHPVLMGRKTAESIGKALPGRLNLVLSRAGAAPFPEQEVVRSLTDAASRAGSGPLMVIGGGEVYRQCLARATRLELTEVDTVIPDPDTFFPPVDPARWREVRRRHHPVDARHAHAFDWVEYVRRP